MNKSNNIVFKDLDFRIEIISYYTNKENNEEEEVIRNFSNYGMKKEELDQIFFSFRLFKEKLSQFMPVMSDELKDYFIPLSFSKDSLMDGFYRFFLHHNEKHFQQARQDYFKSILFEDEEEENWELPSILKAIEMHSMTDKEKLLFIRFYMLDELAWRAILSFLDQGVLVFQQYYYLIEEDYIKRVKQMKADSHLIDKINQTLHSEKLIQANCEYYISLFQFNRLSVIMQEDYQFVHLGFLFYNLVELKKQHIVFDQTVLNRLKVIADPSRFKILQLLKNKEYYTQELAKHLNLTTATLSHHMDILAGEGLVEIVIYEQNKKNIYFRLNKKEMKQLIEDWKRSFSL